MSERTLRHNRDFQILCVAQGLSRLGTQISGIAFPLLVLRVTRSATDTGLVAFAEGAALALALLPGGAIADHFNRRAVMVTCDIGCALTMIALMTAVLTQSTSMAVIVPAAVVVAALGATYQPAAAAALRLIVTDSELPVAVSVSQARNAAVTLAGPALGGLMFGVAPSLPFAADAMSFAISLLGTLTLRARLAASAGNGNDKLWPVRDIARGMTFIWQNKLIRITLVNASVLNFALTGVLLGLIVAIIKGGSTALTVGVVIGFAGLGSLAGSLAAPLAQKHLSLQLVLVLVASVCTATVATMAFTRSIPLLATAVGLSALLVPALNVVVISIQTQATPDALQGRVQSAMTFLALSATPLGSIAAGYLLGRWKPGATFLTFAAAICCLAVMNLRSRSLRQSPVASPSPQPHARAHPAAREPTQ